MATAVAVARKRKGMWRERNKMVDVEAKKSGSWYHVRHRHFRGVILLQSDQRQTSCFVTPLLSLA